MEPTNFSEVKKGLEQKGIKPDEIVYAGKIWSKLSKEVQTHPDLINALAKKLMEKRRPEKREFKWNLKKKTSETEPLLPHIELDAQKDASLLNLHFKTVQKREKELIDLGVKPEILHSKFDPEIIVDLLTHLKEELSNNPGLLHTKEAKNLQNLQKQGLMTVPREYKYESTKLFLASSLLNSGDEHRRRNFLINSIGEIFTKESLGGIDSEKLDEITNKFSAFAKAKKIV